MTGVQTCALPISTSSRPPRGMIFSFSAIDGMSPFQNTRVCRARSRRRNAADRPLCKDFQERQGNGRRSVRRIVGPGTACESPPRIGPCSPGRVKTAGLPQLPRACGGKKAQHKVRRPARCPAPYRRQSVRSRRPVSPVKLFYSTERKCRPPQQNTWKTDENWDPLRLVIFISIP